MGFIGAAVVQLLSRTDRSITILGRATQSRLSLPPNCTYVSGDYGNHTILSELLEPGVEIIDLAYSTVPKTSYGDPVFDLVSNIPPSVGLLQEALKARASKIVVVSSGGTVYGPARVLPIEENHPTEPISPYGITKLAIDHYALMFHRTMDLPVVIARPANAYGETQRAGTGQGFLAAAIQAVLSGRVVDVFGTHGTVRDYIHVDDVARGIVAILDQGVTGEIYNIGTGEGTSQAQILEMLTEITDDTAISIKHRVLPERRFDVSANILDSGKLHRLSGWNAQVQLRDGLERMWNAFLQRHNEIIATSE